MKIYTKDLLELQKRFIIDAEEGLFSFVTKVNDELLPKSTLLSIANDISDLLRLEQIVYDEDKDFYSKKMVDICYYIFRSKALILDEKEKVFYEINNKDENIKEVFKNNRVFLEYILKIYDLVRDNQNISDTVTELFKLCLVNIYSIGKDPIKELNDTLKIGY